VKTTPQNAFIPPEYSYMIWKPWSIVIFWSKLHFSISYDFLLVEFLLAHAPTI